MNPDLLEQFLAEECTPYVRDLLGSAMKTSSGPEVKRFEFNRFEVTLHLRTKEVILEDVLDLDQSGTQKIPMKDFLAALAMSASETT
jgi:hypothetical protein